VKRLEYAPFKGQEDRPPQFANTVVVDGGTDAVVLNFYHISQNTLIRVFDTSSTWEHVQRDGERVTVRSEPIARIALPFGVALDVVTEVLTTIIEGIPDFQQAGSSFSERVLDVLKAAQSLKTEAVTKSDDAK